MKLESIPRTELKPKLAFFITLVSLLCGFIIISLIFLLSGTNPLYAFYRIFLGSFGSSYSLGETITKAIPLLLVGLGLCLPFAGKFWNIGAEGQILIGALMSCFLALGPFATLPPALAIILIFLLSAAAGALWAIIPAVLKIKLGTNEVISTLMLNYLAIEFVTYLVLGPLRGKNQHGQAVSDTIPSSLQLWTIPGTRIHLLTLVLGFVALVAIALMLRKSKLGYEIRVIGENQEAARYAGIDFLKVSIIMMAVSGALAGLAGAGEFLGIHHKISSPPTGLSGGYGFTAIIVAWLARLNPFAVLVSSFLFAGIIVGGDAIQISLRLPVATVSVINGILLLSLIAGEYFMHNKLRVVR